MARMPVELKERLKREVSIQRLAEARGIKLRRSGKELIGLCPFHDDRNPSLCIDPVKNVWSCKGACGEGGDVIRWVARAEGISDTHALELLKGDYLPIAAGAIQPVKKEHGAEAARAGDGGRNRPGVDDARGGLLLPHVEAVARCDEVPGRSRHHVVRGNRPLQTRLLQSVAGLASAGEKPRSRRQPVTQLDTVPRPSASPRRTRRGPTSRTQDISPMPASRHRACWRTGHDATATKATHEHERPMQPKGIDPNE
jgi:hypothetical protein